MTYVQHHHGNGTKEDYCGAVREVKKIKADLKRTGKSKSYINKVYNGMGCPTGRTRCRCCKWERLNKKENHTKKKREIKNIINQDSKNLNN
jgi:hypothetical protein